MKLNKLARTLLFVYYPGLFLWVVTFMVSTLSPRWVKISLPISNGIFWAGTIIGWIVTYLAIRAITRAITSIPDKTARIGVALTIFMLSVIVTVFLWKMFILVRTH